MKSNKMAFRREFLEQMSTQELDKMLHEELQKETMDDELIRQILDVLESRESDYREEHSPTVIEASKKLESIGYMPNPKRNLPRVLKAASILLVVGLLLFTLPRVAHAENLLELFARWTDSVFEFFNPAMPNERIEYAFKTDNSGLQQVYDAVVELGVTDPVVPMWVPTGYELGELEITKMINDIILDVNLLCDDGYICLSYIYHEQQSTFDHEKDKENVKPLEINGVTHYVFSDQDKWLAAWVIDEIECTIYSNCQENDFIKILYSIYTMEE